jgi:hypothetical protein
MPAAKVSIHAGRITSHVNAFLSPDWKTVASTTIFHTIPNAASATRGHSSPSRRRIAQAQSGRNA